MTTAHFHPPAFENAEISHSGRAEREVIDEGEKLSRCGDAGDLVAAPRRDALVGGRDRRPAVVAGDGLVCGAGAYVSCTGKGRKQRSRPLSADAAKVLRAFMDERAGDAEAPVFPGPRGARLTRDAVNRIVARHVARAALSCPSLAGKQVSPHVLRHSCAMQLLEAGVDVAVIALWLGHFSGVGDLSRTVPRSAVSSLD